MTSKLVTAFAVVVLAASAPAESEMEVTAAVIPQKNVEACEISRIFTKTYVTDYAWTVSGLEDVMEYHQDQRVRMDLDAIYKPQNFPAANITFNMHMDANYTRSESEPRLTINAFYTPHNYSNTSNDLVMYKFQVALKVGQNYYVHPTSSRSLSRWGAFPRVYSSGYSNYYNMWANLTSNSSSSYYWNKYDWSSSMGSQDGILLDDIKALFAAAQEQGSPANAITFIFKVTALEFMGAPFLKVDSKVCETEDEQVMTFDSLVENGFGTGLPTAQ